MRIDLRPELAAGCFAARDLGSNSWRVDVNDAAVQRSRCIGARITRYGRFHRFRLDAPKGVAPDIAGPSFPFAIIVAISVFHPPGATQYNVQTATAPVAWPLIEGH